VFVQEIGHNPAVAVISPDSLIYCACHFFSGVPVIIQCWRYAEPAGIGWSGIDGAAHAFVAAIDVVNVERISWIAFGGVIAMEEQHW
jgi:hypothetical protein